MKDELFSGVSADASPQPDRSTSKASNAGEMQSISISSQMSISNSGLGSWHPEGMKSIPVPDIFLNNSRWEKSSYCADSRSFIIEVRFLYE
jgi:hypothetical protein